MQQLDSSLYPLDQSSLNLFSFFHSAFLKRDTSQPKSNELDYEKIKKSLAAVEEMQRSTCEMIASNVDSHLAQYVEISSRFEKMRGKLEKIETVEKGILEQIGEGKTKGEVKVRKLENILGNYRIFIEQGASLIEFKEFVQKLKEVKNIFHCKKIELSMFELANSCRQIQESQSLYKTKIVRSQKIRELATQYNIEKQLTDIRSDCLSQVELTFKQFLLEYSKFQEMDELQKQKLTLLLTCFSNLGAQNACQIIFKHQILNQQSNQLMKQ